MKIKMGISPRSPEIAESRYWAVTALRAVGILQIICGAAASFVWLQPVLTAVLISFGMAYDAAGAVAVPLSLALGVLVGFGFAAMTFAIATAFDDLHTIRGYLRDMTLTGQYYDE